MGKAAERLAISQPVVSKAISDMEHAWGAATDRSQRGVEPTPYGRALIKRGIAIFDEMRQGIEEIEFLSDPTAGEVRIGATDPINAAIVAPVIDRLSRQYPRMTFMSSPACPGRCGRRWRRAMWISRFHDLRVPSARSIRKKFFSMMPWSWSLGQTIH